MAAGVPLPAIGIAPLITYGVRLGHRFGFEVNVTPRERYQHALAEGFEADAGQAAARGRVAASV